MRGHSDGLRRCNDGRSDRCDSRWSDDNVRVREACCDRVCVRSGDRESRSHGSRCYEAPGIGMWHWIAAAILRAPCRGRSLRRCVGHSAWAVVLRSVRGPAPIVVVEAAVIAATVAMTVALVAILLATGSVIVASTTHRTGAWRTVVALPKLVLICHLL